MKDFKLNLSLDTTDAQMLQAFVADLQGSSIQKSLDSAPVEKVEHFVAHGKAAGKPIDSVSASVE